MHGRRLQSHWALAWDASRGGQEHRDRHPTGARCRDSTRGTPVPSIHPVSKHVKFDMIDTFDMDVKTCQTMSNVCQYVKTMFDRDGVHSF